MLPRRRPLAAAIRYSLVMGGAVASLARPAMAQDVAAGSGLRGLGYQATLVLIRQPGM
jgi:hypothetical protein